MEKEKNNKKILKLLKENKELIIMVPTVVLTFWVFYTKQFVIFIL